MCGRFSLTATAAGLVAQFQLTHSFVMVPRYNIAPTEVIPVIRKMGVLEFLNWGLKPSWMDAAQIKDGFVNARAETARIKPAFRNAVYKRRCLIIADGYYEWKRVDEAKQPFYVYRKDHTAFALAGLWEGETCTLLTTVASEKIKVIHERMPIIIPVSDYATWLNPKTNKEWVNRALSVKDKCELMFHQVSPRVNLVGVEGAACIRAL